MANAFISRIIVVVMARKVMILILGCFVAAAGLFFVLSATAFPKLAEVSIFLSPKYSVADLGETGMIFVRSLSAVLGGLMIGWGITIMYFAYHFTRKARLFLLIAIITWFTTDSIGSLLNDLHYNVILNAVFLIFGLTVLFLSKTEEQLEEKV